MFKYVSCSLAGSFLICFAADFCHASLLKFARFGCCAKKGHMACDPQKPMDFQDFCMCAAPPATQQGRQQRTKHSIEKCTKKTSTYVLNCLFLPLGQDVQKKLQK